jgi:hypothetical protein
MRRINLRMLPGAIQQQNSYHKEVQLLALTQPTGEMRIL